MCMYAYMFMYFINNCCNDLDLFMECVHKDLTQYYFRMCCYISAALFFRLNPYYIRFGIKKIMNCLNKTTV